MCKPTELEFAILKEIFKKRECSSITVKTKMNLESIIHSFSAYQKAKISRVATKIK